ncbi:Dam family site-specific DNA-(adenine-N6)-methyltransferase [Devosia rhodophyticola]|uniref:Site-specific DNA-methyltransferase (adenine-specific) n=1 Tax=Devosia rhodophyticola TaxID=3026423 RepID=A0ABY7YV70_9HYPH|nr:Dam family site-specific DNA-(adenine-N6)-methyltransferase [Devosia rhodophyticola]WDR05102.1 Dam family site-specific DNA-(adenine-N6)-methyltransferase [Devosia rhodophyticola]
MSRKPFLKWAGGKRWLVDRTDFRLPPYSGRYIEPFLGGGAVFFSHRPKLAILSDANPRLIEVYKVIRSDWTSLIDLLEIDHNLHSKDYYYSRRSERPTTEVERAAQFIYLNRSCWNGLYRVNQRGEFNVPIGTKSWILSSADDFGSTAKALAQVELVATDFEETVNRAVNGDLIFADPPYTVAHNFNGFVKYNESIFSWDDQIRLKNSLIRAASRGVTIRLTNADHPSVRSLYNEVADIQVMDRRSVISGQSHGRNKTTELLISMA